MERQIAYYLYVLPLRGTYMKKRRISKWNDEQLKVAVRGSTNISDVLRLLGLRVAGGNHRSIRYWIDELGLDISHFSNEKQLSSLAKNRPKKTDEEVLCVDSKVSMKALKRVAREKIKYICNECKNDGNHNGKLLILQLDHINGNNTDNRLENLRWLCPNCHSQTDTFSGRNRAVSFCKTCKIPTLKKSEYCSRECRPKLTTPLIGNTKPRKQVNWPDANVVFNRVLDVGYEKCGIELNVSGNGVKRFLSRNNLIVPRYHAQSKY